MKKHNTIFFDLDGTLTDPGIGITNSVAHAYRHYGMDVPERHELYKFIGPPLVWSFMTYCGFTESKAKEAVEVYREYFHDRGLFENELYKGIPELLSELKKSGRHLVLATSKPDVFSVRILEHFDLAKYFEFVAAATMNETRTNKHDIIEYAIESLNIPDRSQLVMVGDREHDAIGAKKSGVASIGVLYGYGSRQELENAGADMIAASVEELKQILL